METLRFLTSETAAAVRDAVGTPAYVYDEAGLRRSAAAALAFPNAFGLTVRYAMKAAPTRRILRLFDSLGLHFDASSGYEVRRLLAAGVAAEKISLSSQELPADFAELLKLGVKLNACSLRQLEAFCLAFPSGTCGLRFNPGLGSGHTGKVNVGGPHSSFGIWHEWSGDAARIAADADVTIERIHTHIGSGSDPDVWARTAKLSLALVERFPEAMTLNLGGGYKVGRMRGEQSTDLQVVAEPVKKHFEEIAANTGRRLHLEIEPGTFLVCNNCSLLATLQDIVTTGGPEGLKFYKLDTGMTELLRPSLYGAQHPVVILPANDTGRTEPAMVVGHCCESGDIITCAPGKAETLGPRELPEAAPGDLCVIEGTGAYASAMSAKNYNSFPEAPEVLLTEKGALEVIRKRQTLEQITANEV
ncbi:MAG: diaminopimelate decarboxylase [Opitutales bacterium]